MAVSHPTCAIEAAALLGCHLNPCWYRYPGMQLWGGTLDETGETPDCSRGYEAVGIWAVKLGRFRKEDVSTHSLVAGLARHGYYKRRRSPLHFAGFGNGSYGFFVENLTQLLIN